MEEIKIGEYVRTDNGLILRYNLLEKNDYEIFFGEKGKGWTFEDEEEFEDFIKTRIIKHSKNIVDLIEEGDHVNGELVEDISIGPDEFEIITTTEYLTNENDIKSIVTKEQFKSVEYKVEE